jgi:probable DNA metabolism protein
VAQTERKIHREKHRMEAFIRFRLTKDNIYFATIEPDFNVLPLLLSHFKERYADQQWIIYDTKRKAGLFYNLHDVADITISFNESVENETAFCFNEQELMYQELWKGYFTSTNIVARKNLKLHVQHVPRRYWKYLIEKQ